MCENLHRLNNPYDVYDKEAKFIKFKDLTKEEIYYVEHVKITKNKYNEKSKSILLILEKDNITYLTYLPNIFNKFNKEELMCLNDKLVIYHGIKMIDEKKNIFRYDVEFIEPEDSEDEYSDEEEDKNKVKIEFPKCIDKIEKKEEVHKCDDKSNC